MTDILGPLRDWLPTGTYLFKGGPVDGQHIAVKMIEFDHGYGPPDIWRVQPTQKLPRRPVGPKAIPTTAKVTVSTYRFVRGARWNEGHYEVVE